LTYLPITSDLLHAPDLRVPITATAGNGLRLDPQVMVDMIQTSSLARFDQVIGHVDALTLIRVEAALAMHLGLVDGPGATN
jgi:mRNA-degrading endonuclease toxin of MazEF toxin-antitoxin module